MLDLSELKRLHGAATDDVCRNWGVCRNGCGGWSVIYNAGYCSNLRFLWSVRDKGAAEVVAHTMDALPEILARLESAEGALRRTVAAFDTIDTRDDWTEVGRSKDVAAAHFATYPKGSDATD